ncbi:MAG: Ig-like domain-containing protein [Caldilineaceae bacterium]|nr:Ig-like domain-containing protein [Caldilineaceae bacterium]
MSSLFPHFRRSVSHLLLALIGVLAITSFSTTQAAPRQTTIISSGYITQDTEWTKANGPYEIANDLTINPGITLTIHAGVEVRFRANTRLIVNGTLIAVGTAGEKILFTGVNKTPGAWKDITVQNVGQNTGSATLHHVIVEYGGDPIKAPGLVHVRAAALDMRHSTLRHSGRAGLIFSGVERAVTVQDSEFNNNAGDAVHFVLAIESDPVLKNLKASGNGADGVVLYFAYLGSFGDGEGSYVLEEMGLPYLVSGDLTVSSGSTLTIEPGVEMRFQSANSAAGAFFVNGNLKAQGTAQSKIRFTSVNPTVGSWKGINLTLVDGKTALFDHVIVEYGGVPNQNGGNMAISSGAVTVTNTLLQNGGSHGIFASAKARLHVADSEARDNTGDAFYFQGLEADATLRNLKASGNANNAVVMRGALKNKQTWEPSGLPYEIDDVVIVDWDATLTVDPGVAVRFRQGSSLGVYGSLIAVGSADAPITFTGTNATPGWWRGIAIGSQSASTLQHCDVGYGGGNGEAMIGLGSNTILVSNCHIHHSAGDAILADFASPTLTSNRFEANVFGVRNPYPAETVVDARHNWWGHANGPRHEGNPNGQGDKVSDGVLYDPWLTEPGGAPSSGLSVSVMGPKIFAPGSTQTYAIFYQNDTEQPVQNGILVVSLPSHADYENDSGGGILYPSQNQIFWKLGTLAAGATGMVSVQVLYDWGLPDGVKDSVIAHLGGSNAGPVDFDFTPYLSYTPRTVVAETELTQAQVNAERQSYPEVEALFGQAIAEGSVFSVASRLNLSDGQQTTRYILLRFQPQFVATVIWRHETRAVALVIDPGGLTVRRTGGAIRYDLQLGGWQAAEQSAVSAAAVDSIWTDCMEKCIIEKIPTRIAKKFVPGVSAVNDVITCAKAAEGDVLAIVDCGNTVAKQVIKKDIPGLSDGIDLGTCNSDCQGCNGECTNPKCYCCTEDRYLCGEGGFPYWGVHTIEKYECDTETGRFKRFFGMLISKVERVCATCEKCTLNGNSASCITISSGGRDFVVNPVLPASLNVAAANPDGECNECRAAKDPNAKVGLEGDLVPGQIVTYTITYENVGDGEAYGVYIKDTLSEHFDDSTLTLYGNASYVAASRAIFWEVGTLDPAGEPGATGVVSFTVRLKTGLPSGTVIANGATVYFPSVPEVTPTNVVVNTIQPLVAIPQTLTTRTGEAVAIKLAGREVAGLLLTFALVEEPLYGALSGSLPNLVYTPAAGFVGQDQLRFTVNNGTMTSRPALVIINVQPSTNDKNAPTVTWTSPTHNAAVEAIPDARFISPGGPVYAPILVVQFSEAMDGSTLTAASLHVKDASNRALAATVAYDAKLYQAAILLLEPLQANVEYTASVSTAAKDANGNPLAAAHTWRFHTQKTSSPASTLFLPVVTR